MNGIIDDKKRSVVPTAQSMVCVCVRVCLSVCDHIWGVKLYSIHPSIRNYTSDLHQIFCAC